MYSTPTRPHAVLLGLIDNRFRALTIVFAERFTEMVGNPPTQYFALWRMQLAASLLSDGAGVAAVAESVGYEPEAAFSRAFKKLVGEAPGTWRGQSALCKNEGRYQTRPTSFAATEPLS